MLNLVEIDNKIHLLLEGKKTFYNRDGDRLIADKDGDLKVIRFGIIYDAEEEDFKDLLNEYTPAESTGLEIYTVDVTLIDGRHRYAPFDSSGDLKLTNYPQLVLRKNIVKLQERLNEHSAVESANFRIN